MKQQFVRTHTIRQIDIPALLDSSVKTTPSVTILHPQKIASHIFGGPGIEPHWGRDFSHPSVRALGPAQPPIQWVPTLVPGVKTAGAWRGVNHPSSSSAEVKERAELYFYSSPGPLWPLLGRTFILS